MERFTTAFDRVVDRFGSRIAIDQDGSRRCLYCELAALAAEIERMIVFAGIPSQSVIGIEIEKSIESVACLIGVWRADCVAMPISDAIPAAVRDEYDRRAAVAATLQFDPQSITGVRLIVRQIDRDDIPIHCQSSDRPDEDPCGRLAYLFHTSGSTGRSKCVAVSHRGLVRVLKDQIRTFGLNDQSRSLFYLSIDFDASLSDIGTAMLSGATLVIDSDIASLTVSELMRRIQVRAITYADLPPAVVARVAKLKLELPSSLTTVVIGGERCTPSGIDWFSRRVNLFNVYGPTEATICTSIKACEPSRSPSIGTPIAGMRYQIAPLEENDRPASDGVQQSGELWISGPGLAIGYLNDPDLTQKRFVNCVDGDGLITRWYRTGDHVRLDSSGEYEFLGRIDHQFKLLGKLVEPEQILRELLDQPGVMDAVIVPVWQDHGSARAICAVVRPVDGVSLDAAVLRDHLHKTLPTWMVPTLFRLVAEIPKTTTGKTDLVAVTRTVLQQHTDGTLAPDTCPSPDSERMRKIWVDVLGHDDFDWDDTLVTAGGSSLTAIEIAAHAEAEGLAIDLSRLQHQRLCDCVPNATDVESMSCEALNKITREMAHSLPPLPPVEFDPLRQRQILLTGATGFLGTWVLETLLDREPDLIVHCLVRADDPAHALRRLCDSRSQFLGRQQATLDMRRTRILCGDICKPNLGLISSQWHTISREITDIVHLAARVHLLDDFESLRPANLDPLTELIRLASVESPKAFHYASTLSVFVNTDRKDHCFFEADRLQSRDNVFGGYGQTKWAAEDLVWRVATGQTPSVYRFGLLTGDSGRGVGPEHDQLAMFTRGIVRLGCFPESLVDASFDVTPVDDAARAMVHLLKLDCTGAFHLCGPVAISTVRWVDVIGRSGFKVQPVSTQRFSMEVRRFQDTTSIDPQATQDVAAAALAVRYRTHVNSPAADPWTKQRRARAMDLFLTTGKCFDTSRASAALGPSGIAVRTISDAELMQMAIQIIKPSRQRRP